MHAKLTPKQVEIYLFGVWCLSYMSYWIYCVIVLKFWSFEVSKSIEVLELKCFKLNLFSTWKGWNKKLRKKVKLMMEGNLHHLYILVHTCVKHFTCCHGFFIFKSSNGPLISFSFLDFFHNSQWFHFKHPNWLYCS